MHLFGDAAVFDSWGYKSYKNPDNDGGHNKGGSVALIRRSYYAQYMYSALILCMEQGWCEGKWAENRGKLSPLGVMHNDCAEFVKRNGSAGEMIRTVALLSDYYSGWMPARHIAGQFVVWNGIDYEAGDYLNDRLISMFYPGYEDSGFFHNETGAMCETPYGEIADCLLSDVRLETLSMYPVVAVASELFSMTDEVSDKLRAYVSDGGTLFITAANAEKLFPEWGIGGETRFEAGAEVRLTGAEALVREPNAFIALNASALPNDARILARLGDVPLLACVPLGGGRVLLSLTPYGINADALPFANPGSWFGSGIDNSLGRPYELLAHLSIALDELFASASVFSAGEGLGVISTRLGEKQYRVCVYNVSGESKPFSIASNIGEIESVRELSTGQCLFGAEGWWPNGIVGEINGASDEANIYGGDVRMFGVTLVQERAKIAEPIRQPAKVKNVLLALNSLADAKEQIRRFPTFFDYFSGVAVPARALIDADERALTEWNKYFALQKFEIAANTYGDDLSDDELEALASKLALVYDDGRVFSAGRGWTEAGGARILNVGASDANTVYRALRGEFTSEIEPVIHAGVCRAENANNMLSIDGAARDILDIARANEGFFDIFGGVAVSGEYLRARSIEKLRAEAEQLSRAGIAVALDLTEEINHFPGRTLISAIPERLALDEAYYRECIEKLALIGGRYAIFTTHAVPESGYSADETRACMARTLRGLAEFAEPLGIRILLANTRFRYVNTVAEQRALLKDVGAPNTGICLNLNHANAALEEMISAAGDALACVILGAPGSGGKAEYAPVAMSGFDAELLNSLGVPLIEKTRPNIWAQTLKDAEYMNWGTDK